MLIMLWSRLTVSVEFTTVVISGQVAGISNWTLQYSAMYSMVNAYEKTLVSAEDASSHTI